MPGRLLFVCAQGSARAALAASLLQALAAGQWEVWSTPPDDQLSLALVEQVLREQARTVLSADRFVQPTSGMVWKDVIILCSGTTDT
jgi:protein-tyrosine-phosphatase